jgi:hypothetical protein
MNFVSFKKQVIADLGKEWEPNMEDGFRDYEAEMPENPLAGYQFQIPTVDRAYSYDKKYGWYYSCPAGQGRHWYTLKGAIHGVNVYPKKDDLEPLPIPASSHA